MLLYLWEFFFLGKWRLGEGDVNSAAEQSQAVAQNIRLCGLIKMYVLMVMIGEPISAHD